MTTIFGNIVSARDIELRVVGTLQYWMETYLRERELSLGLELGFFARPASYKIVNAWDDKNPEYATPCIMVISDGLVNAPTQEGTGLFMATWGVSIGIIAEATTVDDAEIMVKDAYLPVIRMIMIQKQSLRDWSDPDAEPFGLGNRWTNEQYPDITGSAERSLFAGQQFFEVMVHDVVDRYSGPVAPADPVNQPGDVWEEFTSGSVAVEKIDEE